MDFEGFVEHARTVVEDEARAHAEDRWWVLEPAVFAERRDGRVERAAPDERLLRAGDDLRALPDALRARRVAVALHVDLLLDGRPVPAIVLAVAGRMAASITFAVVGRTDAGTPRLGPWQPGPELAGEISAALRRALVRGR